MEVDRALPYPEEAQMSKDSLEATLRRVRGLIARAEYQSAKADDPNTPEDEAAACRAEANACESQADALMLKYRIDEIGEAPEPASLKPMISTVVIGDSEITGYVNYMMTDIAKHCRCKTRSYTSWTNEGWNAKVYGFESDVRYFEMLYTSTRLHMLGILLPKIDRNRSLEDNCYRLHNSGYNWLQIAAMYGWKKWDITYHYRFDSVPPAGMKVPFYHEDEGWKPSTYVGGIYKRAYLKEVKARGETGQKIAANGTETYRKSAADGYISTIHYRLRQMEKERDSSAALVLASTADAVDKLFRDDNPDLFVEVKEEPSNAKQKKVRMRKAPPLRYNADAYQRGAAHAQNADLNGNSRAGSASRTELHG
jgi:hypothetical protein